MVPTASATLVMILKPDHSPVAGEEDRHVEAREHRLGGARDRGGLAAGVVPHHGEPAAGAGDADEVAVAQGVGGAVQAGRLAVPHAEHAVVLRARQLGGQLAAPRRGGAELLVEPGHVPHVMVVEELPVPLELLVEPAQRRALIARDHRARVKAAGAVGAVLVEHETHEPLQAGEEHAALVEQVLVVEGDLTAGAFRLPVPAALKAAGGPGVRAAAA
jgi:hypothetical protein